MDGWFQDFIIAVASMVAVVFMAWIAELTLGIPRDNFVICVILVMSFMLLFRFRRFRGR